MSLTDKDVYKIPLLLLIGWRGEPGVHDEPQHIYQGEITVKLLDDLGIDSFIIGKETTDDEVANVMADPIPCAARAAISNGRLGAKAASNEVRANRPLPMMKNRRLP